ncbi:flagellar biosynthetic protein FliR [Ferviditalea candida]|uniref:Flagellar biosynthetic protein FliR n=1 Tax=Ferviditalea candida TaxID=3108399 RepID=A0ABU5ZF71_9BACL|nr:flagellar biosynthetic protein FliR [Paenibacillaceae bacterium T2]
MQILFEFLPNFFLILIRITSFFVAAPVFSSRGVPLPFKIGLSFYVSLLIFMSLGEVHPVAVDVAYILSIVREVLVGLLLGFTAYLFFTVVQVAGSFIDLQMGFGIANVIDPLTGVQSPVFGNLKYMVAILLFLSLNGHHALLRAIMQSYDWIPLDNQLFHHLQDRSIADLLVQSLATMFYLAFQMAAPMVVTMFLVDVALGVLARTAPQFNIFVVGIPVKILVGLVMLTILIPGFLFLFQDLFKNMFDSLYRIMDFFKK